MHGIRMVGHTIISFDPASVTHPHKARREPFRPRMPLFFVKPHLQRLFPCDNPTRLEVLLQGTLAERKR